MIKVLLAEDSPTVRLMLAAMIDDEPDMTVVGQAKDGVEAVDLTARLRPDIVLMDLHMPRMDGLEATKAIMTETPTPIVIVSATIDVTDIDLFMRALRVGALTVLSKFPGQRDPDFRKAVDHWFQTIKLMAGIKVVRLHRERRPPKRPDAAMVISRVRPSAPIAAIGIVASTGGPVTLSGILSALPRDLPVPVLVVQHMANGFNEGFATWLDGNCELDVLIARHEQRIEAGTVYIAPDDQHMGVTHLGRLTLSDGEPVGGFRPSGTFLLGSLGHAYGRAAAGVVLTGMGRDGAEGARVLKERGGYVIVQDEATSVVFGMPQAAIATGCVDQVLPVQKIAGLLVKLASMEGTR